ncbi:uncharacterized protein [Gossypium hirsutum]|uniref:Uncharacterized protein n=1 Tax=Gossypium hirsutum TaxID=3635 RepID=A0A1U8J5F0_GOSHI|nr:uncharacterized protein LOC107901795 [Gossypium hirsutum]
MLSPRLLFCNLSSVTPGTQPSFHIEIWSPTPTLQHNPSIKSFFVDQILLQMLSTTLPTVEFTIGANPLGSNSGVSRATKKVCTRMELLPDMDDSTIDGNGQKVQGSEVPRVSYKLALLGASPVPAQNALMKQDFALTEGNVITEVVEGVPLITFFDRVQEYIERRMSRTIIVKMFGGRIGFINASLNKISLLWSPRCPIQLMDLKNDFFLVRF